MVRVVVIDDSVPIQHSLGRLLKAIDGVDVIGFAADVAAAIRLIEAELPDVVVLDVELADGGRGMDVLRHVVREHPGVQVIALSNYHWSDMRKGFLQAGAKAYFDKSMEFTQARDWIAALVPRCARGAAVAIRAH